MLFDNCFALINIINICTPLLYLLKVLLYTYENSILALGTNHEIVIQIFNYFCLITQSSVLLLYLSPPYQSTSMTK